MKLTHGGDWAGFELKYGRPPLDFSANVSPLGVPEGVQRAIARAAAEADRYPDPLCRSLRQALAQRQGLPQDWILCGNGAADLIFRLALARRPRRALVTAPTFAEYEQALNTVGCDTRRFLLRPEDGFQVGEALLEEITPELDVLFLCEPNNPTGRTTEPALLARILEACVRQNVLFVVDECFQEFLDDPAAHTLTGKLSQAPNLLILKAFTKCYAMAGVRLGYALCADAALLRAMSRAGQPWGVSGLAQAAGLAALKEEDYLRRLRKLIQEQRPLLRGGLARLGCRVFPGEANYLLFFHPDAGLAEKLRRRGVLVRDCSNYAGLGPGWYRAAVRTAEENQAFLRALEEVLA